MKYNEFELLGEDACGIYKITNLINDSCYIGQTSRKFKIRWEEHVRCCGGESNSPLHLAIKKYGIQNFDFCIIEKCKKEELDEREKVWIKYYQSNNHDNYNQTAGGNNDALQIETEEWVFKVIKLLQETNFSQKEIADLIGCSENVVSDINRGIHWHQENIVYPIRLRTRIDVKEIAKDLLNKNTSLKSVAEKYNVSLSTIKRINKGEGAYKIDGYDYPLFKYIEPSYDYVDNVINDLLNSSLTQRQIAEKYNISYPTVQKINSGERHKREDLQYPLRIRNKK